MLPTRSEVSVRDHAQEFEKFLRSRHLRMTAGRRRILEAVFSIHGHHFDADELHARLKNEGSGVSRATVYRTLDLLAASGLVAKAHFGEDQARYEQIYGHHHHDHMICEGCGRIIEFSNLEIEALQERVCAEHGFRASRHSLRIFGLCARCQRVRRA